jgi:hypothetical protein
MQISNLLNPFQAQTGFRAAQSTPALDSSSATNQIAPETTATGGLQSTFRDILSPYDVAEISPRQFSALAQQLFQSRAISADDLRELTQMRAQIDQQHPDPDQPVNLLEFFGQKLQEQTLAATEQEQSGKPITAADRAKLTMAQRQFGWVYKFNTVQSDSSTEALDAVV